MSNEHFKYTSQSLLKGGQESSTTPTLDHLMQTNAALSLMSRLNLLTTLGSRHSIATASSTNETSPAAERRPEVKPRRSYLSNKSQSQRTRPSSFVLTEGDDESSNNSRFTRSFAPPSVALKSLFNSGTAVISYHHHPNLQP